MSDYFGKDVFKLGFGLMRLPKLTDGSIDVEQTKIMVDKFIEAGGTYFDTAYVYDNGESEKATNLALVDRYPREKYTLCTKLNAWANRPSKQEAEQQFYTSLERTGAGYFDYYLLHAIQDVNHQIYDDYDLWNYVKGLKEKGLIKHYGFSFHSSPEMLEKLLTEHPDVDFVQLQINYADWENPNVASRRNYEVARKHGKSITVMEPIKGGSLANPIDSVKKLFTDANPNTSFASWAIRYVASLDGIITVLSGMSNIEQMEDNLSYMKEFKPLTADEQEVIKKAQVALQEANEIPCTACHYCTEGCPMNINIPDIFAAINENSRYPSDFALKRNYNMATKERGKASDCIECGQCESVCPQQLKIIDLLKKAVEIAE